MSPFGLPARTTATIPPRPGSVDTLRVSLQMPHSARAGGELRSIVTIRNPTRTPVRLAPCPSYSEAVLTMAAPGNRDRRNAVRTRFSEAAFFLNCDTIHAIAPGHRVRYEMRLAVPEAPSGAAKFAWHLDTPTEPAAAAVLTIHALQSVGPSSARSCPASHLRLAYGPDISPATGQNPRAVRLTNVGGACVLQGYPTVELEDAAGDVLPFHVADSGDQMVTGAPPVRVRLARGGHAWIGLNKYRCDLGDRQVVSTLLLRLPGATGTATLTTSASDDWGYCGENDPGSTIHVSPFEPTLDRTLAHG